MSASSARLAVALPRRLWWAAGLAMVAWVAWASLVPQPPQLSQAPQFDKLEHAGAYGVLGAWFGCLCRARRDGWRALALLALLGAGLELAQALTPAREPSWIDLAADVAGAALGLGTARAAAPRGLVRWLH